VTPAVRHPGEFRWETRLLAVTTLALTAMGIASCYSSATYINEWYLQATQQVSGALAGGAIFLFAAYADYQVWRRLARPLFLLTLAGLGIIAVVAVIWGSRKAPGPVESLVPSINGARRWLRPGIQVQVSEIARFTLVAWLAMRAAELGKKVRDFRQGFVPLMLALGLIGLLLVAEPSVTMAGLLCLTGATVLLTAGARISHLFLAGVLGAAGATAKILTDSVRAGRLHEFHASGLACDATKQACDALIGYGSGGLLGTGFGEGMLKLGHLPLAYSDYLLAVIAEEWGLIGVIVLVFCFGLFCWMGFRIAKTARDPFGMYLAAGLTASVGIAAFMHAAVVTGIAPATGLTLPFMSAGRVSLVLYLFSAGVIVSVGRRRGRPARDG
jgi:cell division protein FtsW